MDLRLRVPKGLETSYHRCSTSTLKEYAEARLHLLPQQVSTACPELTFRRELKEMRALFPKRALGQHYDWVELARCSDHTIVETYVETMEGFAIISSHKSQTLKFVVSS